MMMVDLKSRDGFGEPYHVLMRKALGENDFLCVKLNLTVRLNYADMSEVVVSSQGRRLRARKSSFFLCPTSFSAALPSSRNNANRCSTSDLKLPTSISSFAISSNVTVKNVIPPVSFVSLPLPTSVLLSLIAHLSSLLCLASLPGLPICTVTGVLCIRLMCLLPVALPAATVCIEYSYFCLSGSRLTRYCSSLLVLFPC